MEENDLSIHPSTSTEAFFFHCSPCSAPSTSSLPPDDMGNPSKRRKPTKSPEYLKNSLAARDQVAFTPHIIPTNSTQNVRYNYWNPWFRCPSGLRGNIIAITCPNLLILLWFRMTLLYFWIELIFRIILIKIIKSLRSNGNRSRYVKS